MDKVGRAGMDAIEKIEIIQELDVPALEMYMEIGWTTPVEQRIREALPYVKSSSDPELIAFFEKASTWLEDAKRKEGVYGKDCLWIGATFTTSIILRPVRNSESASNQLQG
jgi:hypothetical protein